MANKKVQITFDQNIKIKSEPSTSEERLSSFKLPRDLTLGGTAKGKRVFTPNLNVVRNKLKINEPVSSHKPASTRGRGRGHGDGNRRGGRGGKQELIQSHSVFSEGVGGDSRRSGGWGSRSGGGGSRDDTLNVMEKPKVNFKQELRVDKNEEERKMGDIFAKQVEYVDLEPDYDYGPVILPDEDEYKANFINEKKIKCEIKQENEENSNAFPLKKLVKQESANKKFNDISALLESEKQRYVFFQFPDSLPAFGTSVESDTSNNGREKHPLLSENITSNMSKCTLNDLNEGLIGKIVVYKSGAAKLILGETKYNVELGIQRNFLQDLMSLDVDTEKKNGKLINLGQIEGGIVVTPDWSSLFNKIS